MSADPDRLFRGAGLPIWLGVMAVSVIASVVAWVGGQHIETDIRRAFGDGSPQTELDRWLDVQVGAALGETVVLIGHSDRAALRDAVGAARAFIAGSPVLSDEGSAFRLPPGQSLLAHRGYLLSPDDQARLGDVAAAALAAEALRRAYSPTGMASAFGWDADPFGTLGRFATSRWPQVGFEIDGDTPVKRRDGLDWAVLRLRSDARSFGLDGASRTVAALDELAKAVAARSPDARYLDLSISRHTHRAAEQSKREISRIGLVSIVAILFLLTGLFRHPVPFALTVFSVASGMLVGFAAVSVIFGELHLIAMVFGAALIGVAVDYALHLLIADGDGRQRVRAVLPGVSLGLVTTSIAFGGLLLAPFASLRQVAVFAIFGLSGAYLTVFCVLPRLLSADRMVAAPAALRLAARGLAGRQRRRRWAVIGLMVLVGAAVPGLMQLQSRDDLRAMYFSPPDLMAQASRVRAIVGGFDVSQMLIVRGEDQEDVLTALERLTPGLVTLQAQGDLETYLHAARALPSMRRQREAHRLLAETVYAPGAALDQLASGLNAPASWAEARRVAFHASTPLRYETWREDMASTPYPGLIEHLPDGWVGLVRVGGVRDASAVRAWVDTQRQAGVDVVWRDTVASAQQRLGAGREMAARVLLLAAVVVLIVLAVRYGIRGGATVALPSALAVIGTLGLCGWLGSPFTVFRLFALLLVIGLSIDYAVFAREAGEHSTATLLAILLSALTTLLSFGLLALSATPALAEFGATVVVGIVLGLGSTLLLWRVRLSGAAP